MPGTKTPGIFLYIGYASYQNDSMNNIRAIIDVALTKMTQEEFLKKINQIFPP